ncbi:MAG: 3-phosphoshikimate 1-carboxyvinyltransferase [Clostridia bacterium]|nr:3-phosphoshikimate 1-carboxyvinyltransferase [Clostridia bacterium]
MRVKIGKSSLHGNVVCPPSKSVAHRMLICAGLSDGTSVIKGVSKSDDMTATMNVLSAFGAEFSRDGDTLTVVGNGLSQIPDGNITASCLECGSTLRFLIPVAFMTGANVTLFGSKRLMSRPLGVYADIAKKSGLKFELSDNCVTLEGKLPAVEYHIPGNISSQFISGLLFALPFADGESKITVEPPLESAPYIDLTLDALHKFGIEILRPDKYTFIVNGKRKYRPFCGAVEGDWSNAAFFIAASKLGFDVNVSGLDENSLQGDKACVSAFDEIKNGHAVISVAECPDLAPILMAFGALSGGVTLTDTARLKIKESDRGTAMAEELSKLGVDTKIYENEIVVSGGTLHAPNEAIWGHNDHRIVMAMSIMLLFTGGVIDGAEAVSKSLPEYFDIIKNLGGEVLTIEA